MLNYINNREIKNFNKDKIPIKILSHEKEREFCDSIRLII